MGRFSWLWAWCRLSRQMRFQHLNKLAQPLWMRRPCGGGYQLSIHHRLGNVKGRTVNCYPACAPEMVLAG